MIAFVRGIVASVGADSVVVDLGAVGLNVHVPATTAGRLRQGEHTRLETSLIVREDSWSLFGFDDAESREVFEVLLGVTGIGPRIAAAALSVHSPNSLKRAVSEGDVKALCRIPGVGQKVAARMALELKDRLPATGVVESRSAVPDDSGVRGAAVSGLVGLGWNAKEAESAVDVVLSAEPGLADISVVLRSALKSMSRT